ncbi:16S rRNA (cytosine(1402)-N(4))-methyltransferase RsmH [Mycoplasmopsis cynos]|uniref:Ribosomal RNA small subunit methyltransferase H n=1 Tax=Mycoplasmopsis cynos (strain C142) TaxID=1246955 RepID=L0RX03_MYCC1|nr:16S rRNA (cytosine(1402)-N(4))-methyltransferase RsmH [Mycoplasmopsis cynos]WQQ12760.1 16S rRNA (cytosine(1402)-N(4))-methyltransferase RsmH [Mycoplasmopsis cynos]WQQ13968.1 16S rRNA (cytosine(1402)-N(4))-methyltransferase RsmH [Mycoplasmopsis cynos]WQQ17775.1 16S rRNA (cytosine(1402)-N(4))-methyltransferase RsmH [Mycoplasmopsis cynos]WQQ18204.1 16S rRNA (cytosine(1402)-N(4))-methyltransferase RsmH [Mycoplasmopsis cynos]WQQ18956.1 16S rRNA (cytosine(1402)-N(4))-methyltransferase RsmH [Mycop
MEKLHYSVLLNETIDALNIKENGIYVDLTLGMGGHSAKILEKLKTGHLFAFDKDDYALKVADQKLSKISKNYTLIKSDFQNIKSELKKKGVNKVDGIIADLGFSSPQVDTPERGFSYNKDAKLDMRMDQQQDFSAYDLINTYSESKLNQILLDYADVKLHYKVAKAIVKNRPITNTLELVEIIKSVYPAALLRVKNLAKPVFQAIRIEVNNELDSLAKMLNDAVEMLSLNSSLCIITFHSIEDRIVKNFFKNLTKNDVPDKMPIQVKKMYQTKQLLPSLCEINENKRSKSAKLRILKKCL